MESTDFSRRKEFYDDRGEAISLHSMTPSISSSVSSRSSLSSQTHSTVDVPIFLDPEVLVFCDDPHATGPRKLALKLYNPNDFHIRFEIKSTNSERYTVSEPTGTIQDKSWKELIVSLMPCARQHRSSERSTSPSGVRPSRQPSVESATASSALVEEVSFDRFRVLVAPRGVLREKATFSARDVSLFVCHTLAAFKRLSASSSKFPPALSTCPPLPSASESGVQPSFSRQTPHEASCPLAHVSTSSASSSSTASHSHIERCTCSRQQHTAESAHGQWPQPHSPEARPAPATAAAATAAAPLATAPVLRAGAGLLWPALAACCLFALFVPVAEIEELQRQVALLTAQAKAGPPHASPSAEAGSGSGSGSGKASGVGVASSGVLALFGSALSAMHLVPPPDWLHMMFEWLDAALVSVPALWHACALPVAAKCAACFVLGAASAVYLNRFLFIAWRT